MDVKDQMKGHNPGLVGVDWADIQTIDLSDYKDLIFVLILWL